VPALSKSQNNDSVPTSTLTRQWKYGFEAGKSQNPPIAAVTAASFSYLAWTVRNAPLGLSNSARLYGVAAVMTIAIVPWTLLMMSSTNNRLLAKAKETGSGNGKEDDREVGELLKRWTTLNGVRSLLPLVGGVVGLVAVLA
jgi:hypothetical protein